MVYLSTILLSSFITISLIPIMMRLATRYQIIDFPDPRKVHTLPVPRIGGLATALGAFIPVILWVKTDVFVMAYLVGAGTIVFFGLLDDMKGVGYKVKFTGQLVAAIVVVLYGSVRIDSLGSLLPASVHLPEWFFIVLSVVAIVGVTNAINLSDGLDGLAGGISLLGFCCIGYLAYVVGDNVVILLSLSLAGAIFGFLRFNTHPASLFMGDTGSQLLGFSAIVFAIKITQGSTPLSPILPLIILGYPVLDTITVMVERVRKGRSPFLPDKSHFHHRLIHFGLSHAQTVVAIYVIHAVMIVTAVFFKYYTDWTLVISYAVFSTVIICAFAIADRTGFEFKRPVLVDGAVKGRLRKIKDNNWIIRISFFITKKIVPLFLILACLLPADIPGYVSVMAACFGLLILVVWKFAKARMDFFLRLVLYLTVPLVLYLIENGETPWLSSRMLSLYHYSFGIIAFIVLFTVKYSRRTSGFRVTTMDFLVVFIAIAVPNLPEQSILNYNLEFLAVEIIVLLFSLEVLIKELRGRFDGLTGVTMIALILLGMRGVAGF